MPLAANKSSVGFVNPPMIEYLYAAALRLWPDILSVSLLTLVGGLVAVAVTGCVTARLFGRRAGLWAMLSFAVAPWAVFWSQLIWNQTMVPPFAALALGGLLLYLSDRPRPALLDRQLRRRRGHDPGPPRYGRPTGDDRHRRCSSSGGASAGVMPSPARPFSPCSICPISSIRSAPAGPTSAPCATSPGRMRRSAAPRSLSASTSSAPRASPRRAGRGGIRHPGDRVVCRVAGGGCLAGGAKEAATDNVHRPQTEGTSPAVVRRPSSESPCPAPPATRHPPPAPRSSSSCSGSLLPLLFYLRSSRLPAELLPDRPVAGPLHDPGHRPRHVQSVAAVVGRTSAGTRRRRQLGRAAGLAVAAAPFWPSSPFRCSSRCATRTRGRPATARRCQVRHARALITEAQRLLPSSRSCDLVGLGKRRARSRRPTWRCCGVYRPVAGASGRRRAGPATAIAVRHYPRQPAGHAGLLRPGRRELAASPAPPWRSRTRRGNSTNGTPRPPAAVERAGELGCRSGPRRLLRRRPRPRGRT